MQAILDAIIARDPDAAAAASVRHLQNALQLALKQGPAESQSYSPN